MKYLALLIALTALPAHAMMDMNCYDNEKRILLIQPYNGKQAFAFVENGQEIDLVNVSSPLSELLEAKGYIVSNKNGDAAHIVVDIGPVIGDDRWVAKAWGDLLTNDGRTIHLSEFFCKQN